jgi:hypothetical protein
MRVKPRITRRTDGRWAVARPAIGFSPLPSTTVHESWHDAVGSLVDASQHYVAGGQFERTRQHADGVATVPRWTPLEYRSATDPQ